MRAKVGTWISILLVCVLSAGSAFSDQTPPKIGFLGSLSSFAGNYGTAVLEGARVGVEQLAEEGTPITFVIEDDQSETKKTVAAWNKLVGVDRVQGVVGGSWWVNAVVTQSAQSKIPLLSCETLLDRSSPTAETFFILQGDLRNWVKVYEPLVRQRKFKRAAVIRYVSEFGATLSDEMRALFSRDGRTFAGEVEYADIDVKDPAPFILKLRALKPDVIYIDSSPVGFGSITREMIRQNFTDVTVLSNPVAKDAVEQRLVDVSPISEVYYTRRVQLSDDFVSRYRKLHGKSPGLNSDLGYAAVLLLGKALRTSDPLRSLNTDARIGDTLLEFSDKNVLRNLQLQVLRYKDGAWTESVETLSK